MAIFDFGIVGAHPGLLLIEGGIARDGEGHGVGAVVGAVEGEELFLGRAGEGLEITDVELICGVPLAVVHAVELELAPVVVFEVELMLGVDGVHFTVGELGGEERGDEELSHAVERALEGFVANLEVVVGVIAGGVGVVVAAVGLKVVPVFGFVGVFFGAEEEHVFEEMGKATAFDRVAEGADAHGERRGGFVEFGVGEQDDLETVIEREALIDGLIVDGDLAGRNVGGECRAQAESGGEEGKDKEEASVHDFDDENRRDKLGSAKWFAANGQSGRSTAI